VSRRGIVRIALLAVLLSAIFFVYVNYLKTYPLGNNDKLQYIGQVHGGFFPPFSMPYTDYYYGTDEPASALEEFFTHAEYIDTPYDKGVDKIGSNSLLYILGIRSRVWSSVFRTLRIRIYSVLEI